MMKRLIGEKMKYFLGIDIGGTKCAAVCEVVPAALGDAIGDYAAASLAGDIINSLKEAAAVLGAFIADEKNAANIARAAGWRGSPTLKYARRTGDIPTGFRKYT